MSSSVTLFLNFIGVILHDLNTKTTLINFFYSLSYNLI